MPDLQDILTIENETNDEAIEEIKNVKDEIKTEFDDIFVKVEAPSPPSTIDYTEISDSRTKIFSDGDFDDTEFKDHYIPKPDNTYALIPTDIKLEDDANPAEILANPNVNTILPPLNDNGQNDILFDGDDINFKIVPKVEPSPTVGAITPYHTDEEDLEDPGYTDADIDFEISVKREDGSYSPDVEIIEDPTPIEIDEDKFVVTDDGDVIITDPDNAPVECKPIVLYVEEGVLQLPPRPPPVECKPMVPYYGQVVELTPEVEMEEPRTRNLVLKRKLSQDKAVNIKKYITGTDKG